jgi:hypothetical protein
VDRAAQLIVNLNSKEQETSRGICKGETVRVSLRRGPPPVTASTSSWLAQTRPPPDKDLESLVAEFAPDATIPFSHIDDTHHNKPNSKRTGQKEVYGEQGWGYVDRFLNVPELKRQQALQRVETSIKRQEKFTLVLIDPGFDETLPNHWMMLQIVEYLKQQGHQFVIEETIRGEYKALVHRHVKSRVCIVYIAASVYDEVLPNPEEFGGKKWQED